MDGSIQLSPTDRKTLLRLVRTGAENFRYAHVILLLADGLSVRAVRRVTYASFDLIQSASDRFRSGGVNAFVGGVGDAKPKPLWQTRIARWVAKKTPEDFGYFRRRWSCETLAEVLAWETGVKRSAETIRRGLHQMNFVWRRPRPVVGPVDPDHAQKLQRIRDLLAQLPADETAVFQDEVDIHLNPKIGSCWMPRGQQTEVRTPGNNEKRHLAGSLIWRTGTLIVSAVGHRRNTQLFIDHLEDLRFRLRSARRIHVICDNAAFHRSQAVLEYLQRWKDRIVLHYLPKYAPETNPIERVWWQLHETLTRNHRCQTMQELVDDVYEWIDRDRCFSNHELTHYTIAA
jgi:putative transposase